MVQWALIIVRYTILSRILNTSTIIVSFPISEHFPTFAAWNHSIYIDPRISFQEIDRYFFSGCACAYFQIAVETYTDLQFNNEEWTE